MLVPDPAGGTRHHDVGTLLDRIREAYWIDATLAQALVRGGYFCTKPAYLLRRQRPRQMNFR
ncbi:MAG TPA: hypothetical protein VK009_09055 [Chloroflexota bacterium]|nr:hypothetical protein [Chloroflexota bacterium]